MIEAMNDLLRMYEAKTDLRVMNKVMYDLL